jgi:SH3-like domain-containing protein
MKGLVFLGLVGATIYGALVLSSHYLLSRDPAENALAGQSLGNPSNRQLRSWGTDLPSLASSSSQESALPLTQPAVAPASTSHSASSAAATPQADGTAYQPSEWAKVVLVAKVHGDASISSPTVRFYPPGTALQVVSRQNGWVQIKDPTSGESGWVYEQYLSPADGPTATQTAMADTANKVAAEPARANAVRTSKKRVKASRQAARIPGEFAFARFDRRWERRAERRGGMGLFFFGRFARAE